MTMENQHSWFLDHRTGWRSADEQPAEGLVDGVELSLPAKAGGPLSLAAEDGSLGGLTLPKVIAVADDGGVYLLVSDKGLLKRLNRETGEFEILSSISGAGSLARQLSEPSSIAASGHLLYVVDTGNGRVQVFDCRTLSLTHVLRGASDWRPRDVAVHDGLAFVLDESGRVHRHRPSGDRLEFLFAAEARVGETPERVATDREGRIYILLTVPRLHPALPLCRLMVFSPDGRFLNEARDAGKVRDRFDAPAIRMDHMGRFRLEGWLAKLCPPKNIEGPCGAPDGPASCGHAQPCGCAAIETPDPETAGQDELLFNRDGLPARVEKYESPGSAPYERSGRWLSAVLDGKDHGCQWDRIELDLASLPEGSSISIQTLATDVKPTSEAHLAGMVESLWVTHPVIVGETGGRSETRRPIEAQRQLLIQSRQGRYLAMRVDLSGDGFDSPRIRSLRVHYPRTSYLSFLPAVFSSDEDSRWFLERFLAAFQTEWDSITTRVAEFAGYLDPDSVPDQFIDHLAGWLALPLEGSWTPEQKRRLLRVVIKTYAQRGTPRALAAFLGAFVRNIAGLPEDAPAFPQIIEAFRQRNRLVLDTGSSRLGQAVPLWGPAFVGRLKLDGMARGGEVRLVSTGDPQRDLFHEYAHKFRVVVPSDWIKTRDDELAFRRAIDLEKPAHTQYELSLVAPRFRIGVQSTVGVDTIIGEYPVAQLACDDDDELPLSRPPSSRLGYDTVLAGASLEAPGMHLAPSVRVGLGTTLA